LRPERAAEGGLRAPPAAASGTDSVMIDIDPKDYLPDDYRVTWRCPSCEHVAEIKLGDLSGARCQQCDEALSQEDVESLNAFRRLIAS
jgi:hypothetical protein